MENIAVTKAEVSYSYSLKNGKEYSEKTISNIIHTRIYKSYPDICVKLNKLSDVSRIQSGDSFLYTIILQNFSKSSIYNVKIIDELCSDIFFVHGSVRICNENFPDLDITKGIKIKSLQAYEIIVVQFKVTHKGDMKSKCFNSTARACFNTSISEYDCYCLCSNPVEIKLNVPPIILHLEKCISCRDYENGSMVELVGTIENHAYGNLQNVYLHIDFPSLCGEEFSKKRITVNGKIVSPKKCNSICIDSMKIGKCKKISISLNVDLSTDTYTDIYVTGERKYMKYTMVEESNHYIY